MCFSTAIHPNTSSAAAFPLLVALRCMSTREADTWGFVSYHLAPSFYYAVQVHKAIVHYLFMDPVESESVRVVAGEPRVQ